MPENFEFDVHNLTTSSTCSLSEILGAGRTLIRQAFTSDGWSDVKATFDIGVFDYTGAIYAFSSSPPQISVKETTMEHRDLRLWDTSANCVADDEIFDMQELDEFEATNLDYMFSFPRQASTNRLSVPPPTEEFPHEERPSKRRKLDFSPLHSVIPQPHFHPSPSTASVNLEPPFVTPYRKAKPIPVSPLAPSEVAALLNTPYARSAWVVPVRGTLPWDKSTPASVLDSELHLAPSDPPEITWTHSSLCAFWQFLLVVREAATLGPLSLSFHTAPPPTSNSLLVPSIHGQIEVPFSSEPASCSSRNIDAYTCRAKLLAMDHIKIYHDAKYTMYVRKVLDAWRHEVQDSDTAKDKMRVLSGARLVLVDERSQGLLVL